MNSSASFCLANFIQLLCIAADIAVFIYAVNYSRNFLDGAILVLVSWVAIYLVGFWIYMLICRLSLAIYFMRKKR